MWVITEYTKHGPYALHFLDMIGIRSVFDFDDTKYSISGAFSFQGLDILDMLEMLNMRSMADLDDIKYSISGAF